MTLNTLNKLMNNGAAAYVRMVIYIATTVLALGITYGRLTARIDGLEEKVTALSTRMDKRQADDREVVNELRSMNTRLSRIEGALGVKISLTDTENPRTIDK